MRLLYSYPSACACSPRSCRRKTTLCDGRLSAPSVSADALAAKDHLSAEAFDMSRKSLFSMPIPPEGRYVRSDDPTSLLHVPTLHPLHARRMIFLTLSRLS